MPRTSKKITAVLISAAVSAAFGSCAEENISKATPQQSDSFTVFAMDTYMTVNICNGDVKTAADEVKNEIARLEKLWSVTDENSEIYRLDHSSGETLTVSPETSGLIQFALEMYRKTDGALDISLYPILCEWGFTTGNYKIPDDDTITELLKNTDCTKITVSGNDVTIPDGMSIDLGSLGKGETGDRITGILKQNGVSSALLDLGGNIQVIGSKTDGSDWHIALQSPYGEGNVAKLEVSDCCVITSGGYERFFVGEDGETYWHILAPATGRPARNGIVSATVIGDSGRLCDALSTSLFVMGEERAEQLWRETGGFEMILMTDDNRLIMTEGISDKVTVYDDFSYLSSEVIKNS